jgi:glycosyltransferase involved in cell wall biosynthesis
MKISFDFRIFLLQKFGGISRYFVGLFSALKDEKSIHTNIICLFHLNKYLEVENNGLWNNIYLGQIKSRDFIAFNLVRLINHFGEIIYLAIYPPDIYHITFYDRIPQHRSSTKIVVTVHDMIYELYQEQYSGDAGQIKRKCVEAADLVICVSENTKKDLIQLFNIEENKIVVIYLGFKEFGHLINSATLIPHILQKKFILFVGHRFGYKNFDGLAKAYASSTELNQNYQLICFGGGSFSLQELIMIKELDLEGKVFQLDGNDDLLEACYKKSSLFVYPSLYEGFGISPLEAMSCGTPVCCSNTSSLPEVVGDAAILFNPLIPEEIKSAMLVVLNSTAKQEELIEKGKLRIQQFTWEKCASETLNAYQSIL